MSDELDFAREISTYSVDDLNLIINDQKDLYTPEEMQMLKNELKRREELLDEEKAEKLKIIREKIRIHAEKKELICPKCDGPNSFANEKCIYCDHDLTAAKKEYDSIVKEYMQQADYDGLLAFLDSDIDNNKEQEVWFSFKEKDLTVYSEPYRFRDKSQAIMEQLRNMLAKTAELYDAAIGLSYGEIRTGSFLSIECIPCLVVYHPDHIDDYYQYCVTRTEQGESCVFQIYVTGSSRQITKQEFDQNIRVFDGSIMRSVKRGVMKGGALGAGMAIGGAAAGLVKSGINAAVKGINRLSLNKESLSDELDWYNRVNAIFEDIFLA